MIGTPATLAAVADNPMFSVLASDVVWRRAVAPGQRFSRTFDAPGTYAYYCEIHPHMRGQIVVR